MKDSLEKNNWTRRDVLQLALVGYLQFAVGKVYGSVGTNPSQDLAKFVTNNVNADPGNFRAIYQNPETREEFLSFLRNVYNIYPEEKFHQLITKIVEKHISDQAIYDAVLEKVGSIKPWFGDLTYSIPALRKQKSEMVGQTLDLLNNRHKLDGCMEIGSVGRYLGKLKDRIPVTGDVIVVHTAAPNYSAMDIAERGQIGKIGRYVGLNDYQAFTTDRVKENSLDVVANYIGFHHCPLNKLHDFVTSIQKILKPGGSLILRDHDVIDERMNHFVALAHDVFNAGLKVSWEKNHEELRLFRSLRQWIDYLEARGLKYQNQRIFQSGDPTKNALMEFRKV